MRIVENEVEMIYKDQAVESRECQTKGLWIIAAKQ